MNETIFITAKICGINISRKYQSCEIGVKCETSVETIILINEVLEVLKPMPNSIRLDFGQNAGPWRELNFADPTAARNTYKKDLHNLCGITIDNSYFHWDYYSNNLQKIEGRRYNRVLSLDNVHMWIKYHKMTPEQKSKCQHYNKGLFSANPDELECSVFSIQHSTIRDTVKKILYMITFELPVVLAIRYESIINYPDFSNKNNTHPIALLFVLVTWALALSPSGPSGSSGPSGLSGSLFRWFLIDHKLYDPRLLLIIGSFIDDYDKAIQMPEDPYLTLCMNPPSFQHD